MDAREIDRRGFLLGTGAVLGGLLLPRGARGARGDGDFRLPEATRGALASSGFVYISPLLAEGTESRCHGEVWFFTDAGDVVIATQSGTWKARALETGRDRARIWVGDYGSVRLRSDAFRAGPTFEARVQVARDRATFDRLLAGFAEKYPAEWGKWEPRFERGYRDGSRIVLRYTPVAA